MTEGTRFGEFKEGHEFKTAVQHGAPETHSAELRPTKIGEMSEFEKGLYKEAGHIEEVGHEEVAPVNQEKDEDAELFKQAIQKEEAAARPKRRDGEATFSDALDKM